MGCAPAYFRIIFGGPFGSVKKLCSACAHFGKTTPTTPSEITDRSAAAPVARLCARRRSQAARRRDPSPKPIACSENAIRQWQVRPCGSTTSSLKQAPDEVIYWHGSSYVIELIFAPDGKVARIALLPETLLHSDSWTDVPNVVELSPGEMQRLEPPRTY